jgi:hypothetical protein
LRKETALLDRVEPKYIVNGKQLYTETYREIMASKLPHIFEIDKEIAISILENIIENLNLLSDENTKEIPRLGTTGEVLTKIALESRGINVYPSDLKEDIDEKFDFKILGRKIDVTTSPLDYTFVKKVTDGHPITLFVPNYMFNSKNPAERPKEFPKEISYAYKLLYENEFDVDMFLKDTIALNYSGIDILKDYYYNGQNNSYNLREHQFGEVTQDLIYDYELFLNDLSYELYVPLDNS